MFNTFNSFTTPQDFFKQVTDFYTSVPKTPAEMKTAFEKLQSVFKTEADNTVEMWKIYAKAAKGDASVNEIAKANKAAGELVKTSIFAGIVSVPGVLFILPALIEKAKEFNVDLVPASVAKAYKI